MDIWNSIYVPIVANDTISSNTTSSEQYFATNIALPVGVLSPMANGQPRQLRCRAHCVFTTTALNAGTLQVRWYMGPTPGKISTATVIGDSTSFNVTGAALGLTTAALTALGLTNVIQITNGHLYLELPLTITAGGLPSSSSIKEAGFGQLIPFTGLPAISLNMLNNNAITTVDCTVPEYLFLGITLGGSGSNLSLALASMRCQFIDSGG